MVFIEQLKCKMLPFSLKNVAKSQILTIYIKIYNT
jgi:hypothetical protein